MLPRVGPRVVTARYYSRAARSVIHSFLFGGRDGTQLNQNGSEQELRVELSELSSDKVDSVVEEVLSKRGVGFSEPLEDLKTKFNVLRDVERKFKLRIPSSQLCTLVNGENIKEFLLFHQHKTERSAKLFNIDTSALPSNLSIKQPTLRVGPKKHVIKDPSDPDNYQHYS